MTATGRSLATSVDAEAAREALGAMAQVAPGASGNVLQSDGQAWMSAPLSLSASGFGPQAQNHVLAAPAGASGVPTFRKLEESDIPNLSATKITNGILSAALMPSFSGDVTTSSGSASATVVGLQGRSVASTQPSDGQVLKWNQAANAWEPAPDNSNLGTVTSVIAGTGLETADGQPITTSGTISIKDGGVGTNQLADGAVIAAKIGDSQVTDNKIVSVSDTKLTGTIKVSSGHVGIGSQNPVVKLDVAGGVKVANETNCAPETAGTIRWTGSAFEGCDGTQWIPLSGGGGGITSCPDGWVLVGNPGGFGTFCIEKNERSPTNFLNAKYICSTVKPPGFGRAHLCYHNEWYTACRHHSAELSNMSTNTEWLADLSGNISSTANYAYVATNCSNFDDQSVNNSYNFRCCLR